MVHADDDAWSSRGHGSDRGSRAENSASGKRPATVLMKVVIGFALLGVFCQGQDVPADPLAAMTVEGVANGKRLFEAQCAPCHGIDGRGGKGANLAVPRLRHAADNQELVAVIREGIPATGMLAAWQLDDQELLQVAAF